MNQAQRKTAAKMPHGKTFTVEPPLKKGDIVYSSNYNAILPKGEKIVIESEDAKDSSGRDIYYGRINGEGMLIAFRASELSMTK